MKLPNVFANTDIRTVDNNDSSCVACNGIDKSLLRSYFDNDGYVNKLNVIISNLEWCTYKYNLSESYRLTNRKGSMLNKKGKLCPNSIKIVLCNVSMLLPPLVN